MAENHTESRWRNYQHLIWKQQQIYEQLQMQQQHHQLQRMSGVEGNVSDSTGMLNIQNPQPQQQLPQQAQQQQPVQQQLPQPQQQNEQNINKSTNLKPNEEKAKEILDPWENFDAQSAFLGPSLWDKRLPYDGQDFKLEYMELEDFLQENGIPVEPTAENGFLGTKPNNGVHQQQQQSRDLGHSSNSPPIPFSHFPGPSHLTGPIRSMTSHHSRSSSPSDSSSCGASRDAISPDSTQVSEMALGAIPGQDFDPRTRAFTDDELKPQPMIKKSKKQFVPEEQKDAKYWSRRRKNNMAAKRSRDARRVKENQIAMRAGFLEKENHAMKEEMDRAIREMHKMKEEFDKMKKQLTHCRCEH